MNKEFNQHIIQYMTHCYSRQLRPKTMHSYESTLRLFERWCKEELGIETVDEITENTIRHYISDIQQRGKYKYAIMEKNLRRRPCTPSSLSARLRNTQIR